MKDLLVKFLKPYWKQITLAIILLVVQAISNLYLPNLNADIINNGVAKGDIDYIINTGGFMLAVTLLLAICAVASAYLGSKTAMAFGRDVRRAIFYKVESFSQAEVDKFGTPSLITRNTNDVQQVQMLVLLGLNLMVMAPIMAIGGIIMALRQDVVLSYSIIIIVPIMAAIVGLMLWKATPLFRSIQVKIDRVNQVMREKLMGVRVIRAFVKNEHEAKRFDEANRDLTATTLKVNRIMAFAMPSLMAVMNLATVAIVWFGAGRIDSGAMPIGNLTAFLTYIMQIMISVMMAMGMFIMVPRAEASAERLSEVLDTEPSIKDTPTPAAPSDIKGYLEFRNVEFSYPGAEEPVLKGISFEARPGQTTAIIGSTGCGKTTLVNLIPRFYDVTGGSILIDGTDIRDMTQQNLRDKIGLVPQKAFLFSGTVADNLRYGNENATDDELWHALEVAQAKDFVMEMPGQLDAPIEQGGTNVSGGQRQRLAIARALVKKPEIYVFDDSFSALDFKTDAKLRLALKGETSGSTVVIVAQRVSTIMDADRIIALNDNGIIAGIGTHAQLMETCDVYREIVYSQLSKEEIA
ncbi:ABC transporter ATP-binding protein [Mahella australiensis]|uniref:ABC transporter related protein n=1 Tax=Mahella australiensis (strain DSM 15567 / CIP 107919 / 50-1 BON) TaxID=697281 RepID=F4A3A7_MAHA5|nr:ABC transporter ATP-binding protein [Mahella australiensis]AEE97362.1 ABC transporter related protein [Mahella australiensis 50-1 BON]